MKENKNVSLKTQTFKSIWKIFAIEGFLFSLTLLLGIFTAFKINNILEVEKIPVPKFSFIQFIVYFILATSLIFVFVRYLKFKKQKGIIFKALFITSVFWGGSLLLSIWIGDLFSLITMLVLIVWWLKWPSVFIQDVCMIMAMAGAGSVLGLTFMPQTVAILLVIFSVYDIIAVYKTKHMVEMAKEMIESRAILGFVIPPSLKDFKQSLAEVKPGGKFMVLGGGDVVFPLLFCSSLVSSGIVNSLIVALFSLIGLLASFLFFAFQKEHKPIPALPPIALFSIIGYLITKLF
ncbi:MAG: presenilin family intramembrane aspartyl protease [Patescibacteria group bacterium]|nr:presenilin family intramembrane aspartyl protease [Patescibacteria group bacterium]